MSTEFEDARQEDRFTVDIELDRKLQRNRMGFVFRTRTRARDDEEPMGAERQPKGTRVSVKQRKRVAVKNVRLSMLRGRVRINQF
jgi:hypothetical protein